LEIARHGEARGVIGALFTVGYAGDVLVHSRPLVPDPLASHEPPRPRITDPALHGRIKQLARLGGAVVIDGDGAVVAAGRYLDCPTEDVALPPGLGSRHLAAAAVSKLPGVVSVAVSASGVVRTFLNGAIVTTLNP
jgi:DNA integrity scanning protein DisA with diadenylate cyclase activity